MPSKDFTLRWYNAGYDRTMTVYWDETYDAATNKSTIKITNLYFKDISGRLYGSILINGTKVLTIQDNVSGWKSVSASPVTVSHNSAGGGSFTMSFSQYGSGYTNFYVENGGNKYIIYDGRNVDPYPVTVSLQSHTRQWALSISEGTGSSITVKRGGSTLSNGSIVTYGETLTVTASAATGYRLVSNPSGTITVTGAVSVSSSAEVLSYTLTMSVGAHSTMTVSRTSSPLKGASTGQLNSGATIYYNDVLSVTCSAATGFHLTTNPGGTKTVTSNITATSVAAVDEFKLTITKDSHVTVTVKRTSSPNGGAATGTVGNNATVYYGDVLKVTFSPSAGYKVVTSTANGTMISSGANVTTTSKVILVFVTDVLAVVHICDGSEFKMYLVEIVKNGEFRLYQPYIYDGNAWKPYM